MTLKNLDGTSDFQINTTTEQDVLLSPGQAPSCRVLYDGTDLVLVASGIYQVRDVNIGDWGAEPSASGAENATAIQNAINYCVSVGGHRVTGQGIYNVGAEIEVPDGIELSGAGQNGIQNTHGLTLVASSSIRSILKVAGQANTKNVSLHCAALAKYGIYRSNDSFSRYDSVSINDPLLDGFHAAAIEDGWTISAVTQTGTDPLLIVTGHPVPLLPGSYSVEITASGTQFSGAVTFTTTFPTSPSPLTGMGAVPGGSSGNVGQTSPFVDEINPVAENYYLEDIGLLFTFPPGSYTSGNVFSFTVTGEFTNNGGTTFQDCNASQCGQVYLTSGAAAAYSSQYTARGITINETPAPGTVSISDGSNTVVGSGTEFLSFGARLEILCA